MTIQPPLIQFDKIQSQLVRPDSVKKCCVSVIYLILRIIGGLKEETPTTNLVKVLGVIIKKEGKYAYLVTTNTYGINGKKRDIF